MAGDEHFFVEQEQPGRCGDREERSEDAGLDGVERSGEAHVRPSAP